MRLFALPLLVLATALALAGCGSPSSSPPVATSTASSATTTPARPPSTVVTVYRVENGVVVPHALRVPKTEAVAGAALQALAPGASVEVAGGTATVAMSSADDALTAAIVYTMTQFPTVQRVDVAQRTGLTRADVAAYAPIILIDAPAAGADVPSTFEVHGSAEVFEATLVVELVRDGKVIETQNVTATAGAPERGTFSATLHALSPGAATVVAFAPSAEDGSRQHEVDVPVTITP